MSKTMIDVLIAVCLRAAARNPVGARAIPESTKKALVQRKLVRKRWLGNTRQGRWVLEPTPLGRGFKRAYDMGRMRGEISRNNDEHEDAIVDQARASGGAL